MIEIFALLYLFCGVYLAHFALKDDEKSFGCIGLFLIYLLWPIPVILALHVIYRLKKAAKVRK